LVWIVFQLVLADAPTNLSPLHSLKEGDEEENEDVGLGYDDDHALLVVAP
jgi:hypothetical protein